MGNLRKKVCIIYFTGLLIVPFFKPLFAKTEYEMQLQSSYRIKAGDHSTDQDIYQYHVLNIKFNPFLFLSYNAGLRKDLDSNSSAYLKGNIDSTDYSMREINDSVNRNRKLEYRIYGASLNYDTQKVKVAMGRNFAYKYSYQIYDGFSTVLAPVKWFVFDFFGGIPWKYNYRKYYVNGEYTAGSGLSLLPLKGKLLFDVRYMNLNQQSYTQTTAVNAAASDNIIRSDDLIQAKSGIYLYRPVQFHISSSFLNAKPYNAETVMFGQWDHLLLDYSVGYYNQFYSMENHTSHLNLYSTLLSAARPYQRVSGRVQKSFADWLNQEGFLNNIELEFDYEKRFAQPGNRNRFNPEYDMFRTGFITAFRNKLFLQLFCDYFITKAIKNNTISAGGELNKKWKTVTLALGSGYYFYKFESDYYNMLYEDTFNAREYYINFKWKINKYVFVQTKTVYEWAHLKSLTNATIDPLLENQIYMENRDYLTLKFTVINQI